MKIFVLMACFALFGAGCQAPFLTKVDSVSSASQELNNTTASTSAISDQDLFEAAIKDYFRSIDSREYVDAYAMLTPAFQTTHPFTSWSDGYKNTLNHSIKSVSCEEDACIVEFIATENTSTSLRKQRYLLQYFLMKEGDAAKIDRGTLLSMNTTEVLREYGSLTFSKDSQITASVVQILCFSDDTFSEITSLGSGTIIRKDGILLSNFHVKAPAPGVCVAIGVNSQGIVQPDKAYPIGRSLFEDPARDIWISQLRSTDGSIRFPALSYKPCTSEQVALGDSVRVYGFPFRAAKGNMVITDGIVSGINRDDGFFVTSAKIDHGNSGGTALNTSKSCFIGIPTAIRGESEVYGQIAGISALVGELPEIFTQ